MCQDFIRVMLEDAYIVQLTLANQLEQATYSRCMYFDADEILVRHASGDGCSGFTHAETDLENHRCFATKHCFCIQLRLVIRQGKAWAEFVKCACLCVGDTACPGDNAKDTMFGRIVEKRLLAVVDGVVGHAVGEERCETGV